ncbi:dihydroneopterin aldolase [Pseudooceanicola sp. 502str34]
MAQNTTKVFVTDLEIEALIGILEHEQAKRQPLFLDIELDVIPPVADDIAQAFDYRAVGVIAQDLASGQIGLVEVFAHRLASHLLDSPLVTAAKVRLRKPMALDNGMAGCEVVLAKDD